MLNVKPLCSFPIRYLQDELKGICTGDFIMVGCGSGSGKSTLSNLIAMQARDEGCPTVLYSLENIQGRFVLYQTMKEYTNETGNYMDVRDFAIMQSKNPKLFERYRRAVWEQNQKTDENGLPLLIVHESVATSDWDVKTLIAMMKPEIAKGYKLFILDHIDVLVKGDEYRDTSNAMKELWALICDNDIAIVTFSQLVKGCRALCAGQNDLRGSTQKVFKATVLITMGRHSYGMYPPPAGFPNAKPTYIRVAKSRDTGVSCAVCFFNTINYLDDYLLVRCDESGTFIDGWTRERMERYLAKKNDDPTRQAQNYGVTFKP